MEIVYHLRTMFHGAMVGRRASLSPGRHSTKITPADDESTQLLAQSRGLQVGREDNVVIKRGCSNQSRRYPMGYIRCVVLRPKRRTKAIETKGKMEKG